MIYNNFYKTNIFHEYLFITKIKDQYYFAVDYKKIIQESDIQEFPITNNKKTTTIQTKEIKIIGPTVQHSKKISIPIPF